MTLQERIEILVRLGEFMKSSSEDWQAAKDSAFGKNQWFVPEFIEHSSRNIVAEFLQKNKLEHFTSLYNLPDEIYERARVGLVMAGNIPMVGFHDMLCIFLSGHNQVIKLSSKDPVLIPFVVNKMYEWNDEMRSYISFAEKLTGCDAYIATGSNNTGRYFRYYFGKYPNIIRNNRTSVAILEGNETAEELDKLADDIQLYFGLGCRNITKLYVPENYDFEPLLNALRKYNHYADFHKYRNNYDYQLALLMMGSKFYMTNESVVLSENKSIFSAVSHVHYEFYKNKDEVIKTLKDNEEVQCIAGKGFTAFGEAQKPSLTDYADGVDTMNFLNSLSSKINEG
ncbi:MAG TPA: acyl-CoA reductase [Segetibacter sp.]|jgi:hypothetical protein